MGACHCFRRLLERLRDKGLRCWLEKCIFAQPQVVYLEHVLSSEGIYRGPKVNALNEMPAPHNLSTLRLFLSSMQFHAKLLPPTFASVAEPLYRLTRKGHRRAWGSEEEAAFRRRLKELLSTADVLDHFDPSLPLGVACNASAVRIGTTLFHHYSDGSERPIANISKTLTPSQRNYSQIQKRWPSSTPWRNSSNIYMDGRKFILVTDNQPLVAMCGPNKPTSALAANRLSRRALFLRQFNYTIVVNSPANPTKHYQRKTRL